MNPAKKNDPSSATVPARKAEILEKLAAVEAENADLKRRLAESEATLSALISEQVDAVIDSATVTPLLLKQTQEALLVSEAALQKANVELEQRVFERTNELEHSRQQIVDILNSIKDSFFTLDRAGRFLYINQVSARNMGYRSEEMVGQVIWEKFPMYRGSLFEEKFRQVLEQKQAVHFEVAGILHQKHYLVGMYPSTEGVSVYSIDASERKRAELALQKERDRSQSYLNIAGTMIVVLDADKKVVLINTRGCQILGCLEDEVAGANWFKKFVPEKSRVECMAFFARILAGELESPIDRESLVLTSQGEERLIAWHTVTFRDETGKISGTLSSGEDVTERRRIERDLRQAYELLETVTQGTDVIIAVVDRDYHYLYFNKAYAEELRRLSGKELTVGAQMLEQFAHMPEQQQTIVESWGPTLQGVSSERIVEFGDPGTYRRIYRTRKTPLWDSEGKVIGAGEVASDVTQQVQAERELQASEKRYHALFNGMTEGFALHRIICDEKGTPIDYHFLDINPAFERLTGLRREEVVGKNKSQIPQLRDDDPKWVEIYGKVALTGEAEHFENFSRPLERYYEVFAYCPEPGQFAVLFMDITARKQAEQQIENLARFPNENPNPILRVDREGKILYANQASRPLLEAWECEAGQHLPRPWHELAGEALASEKTKTTEIQYSKKVYSVQFVPIPGAGYVNLYGRDVTKQVRAVEALLNARNELEARVRERTQALEISNEQLLTEVSERSRAEAALHSAYAYNRSLIDASLDPLVTITPAGKIGDVNVATEAVTGYSREELIGTDFHSYFTDPEKARSGYRQVFELGAVRDYELEIRRRDGHITSVLYNASVYRDESGAVQGIIAAARDITQRKQAEQELQQQEALLRAMMENLPVGVWITDASGNILQGNPAGQSIWAGARYVGVEQYGEYKGWWVSNGQRITADEWAAARAVRKGETSINEEIEIECFDGTHKIILNSAIPLRDARQEIMGAIVVNQDITEIKQAQKELDADRRRLLLLSQSERAQRLFAEGLTQTMLALNSSLDLNEVLDCILEQIQNVIPFRSANVALLEEMLITQVRQRSGADMPQNNNILQESLTLEAFPLWEKLAERRQVLSIDDLAAEPEPFALAGYEWVRAYLGAALRSGSGVVGFINLFSDHPGFFGQEAADRLTAFANQAALAIQNARLYHDLERSLEQEQSMRSQLVQAEKFAAMGRMLASVAHELNNPLQTIQNCLYLTQQDTPEGSPIQEYLEMAFSEIGRLSRMVAQLRELYRPRSAMVVRRNNLYKILEEAQSLLAPHLQNLQVSWEQAPGPGVFMVDCNSDQIKQVFINIGMNAIEAMQPQGGSLAVAVIRSEDGYQVGVVFRDTGPGMPPEIVQNLFEPFFTTKSSGLGLGLSICYELVQRHNGTISVESQENVGAVFTIWLPLAENQDV